MDWYKFFWWIIEKSYTDENYSRGQKASQTLIENNESYRYIILNKFSPHMLKNGDALKKKANFKFLLLIKQSIQKHLKWSLYTDKWNYRFTKI